MAKNRIVVDYYGYEGLVLLAAFNNDTGIEISRKELENLHGFDIVKHYDGVNDIKELKARNIQNQEGYVLRYENGFRMKVKFEDYCRLHSIITNVSTKDIWEFLRDNKNINELLDRTPDEFDDWVKKQVELLKDKFHNIENEIKLIYSSIYQDGMNKKDFASIAFSKKYSSILFKMYDNKKYDHIIWKLIEPEYSKPFFKDDE
jgi:RNA ligase